MDKEGYRRFAEIDCDAILRFRHAIGERRGRGGAYVLPNTLTSLLEALASLYHLRDELGDGLLVDPFLGRSPRQLAGAYGVKHYGPYTPDAIAIPLVQQSIEFLEHGAIDVLRAREIYATTMAQTLERDFLERQLQPQCSRGPRRAIDQYPARAPKDLPHPRPQRCH